jgi:hypothetical protein
MHFTSSPSSPSYTGVSCILEDGREKQQAQVRKDMGSIPQKKNPNVCVYLARPTDIVALFLCLCRVQITDVDRALLSLKTQRRKIEEQRKRVRTAPSPLLTDRWYVAEILHLALNLCAMLMLVWRRWQG